MAQCFKCTEPLGNGDEVITCVECKHSFHPICTKIRSMDKYRKLSGQKKAEWKCEICHAESSTKSDISESSENKILECLEKMRKDMTDQHVEVKRSVTEVGDRVTNVNEAVNNMKETLDQLKRENEDRRQEYEKIVQENIQLKEEVNDLKFRVQDLEQYSRRDNVEIIGVPYTNNENLLLIMAKIAALMNVMFDASDISVVHRMPATRRSSHPLIIARFVRRSAKEMWISGAKNSRIRLTAAELHDNFESTSLYINEHLTVGNKALLGRAREMRRTGKLAFVWTKDTKVLVRKIAEGPVKVIRSFDDLDLLIRE